MDGHAGVGTASDRGCDFSSHRTPNCNARLLRGAAPSLRARPCKHLQAHSPSEFLTRSVWRCVRGLTGLNFQQTFAFLGILGLVPCPPPRYSVEGNGIVDACEPASTLLDRLNYARHYAYWQPGSDNPQTSAPTQAVAYRRPLRELLAFRAPPLLARGTKRPPPDAERVSET